MEEPHKEPSEKPAKKEKKPLSKGGQAVRGIIVAIVLIVVSILVFAPRTKFTVSDVHIVSNTADTVSVSFTVKNDGGTSGYPTCSTTVHSDDSVNAGTGMTSFSTLSAGESQNVASGAIQINDNGAANISKADISCS